MPNELLYAVQYPLRIAFSGWSHMQLMSAKNRATVSAPNGKSGVQDWQQGLGIDLREC